MTLENLRFRIARVDLDGYCGRDLHPRVADIGLIVVPLKMESWYTEMAGGECPMFGWDADDANKPAAGPALVFAGYDPKSDEVVYSMWTCMTESGRVLQLMDHELEIA